MVTSRIIPATLLALCLAARDVFALSQQRNPLSHVARVQEPTLHAPSNFVRAHSDFDITFRLSDKPEQQIRLVLKPNHDILANTAQVNVMRSDGTLKRVDLVDRADHKVFRGDAFIKHPDSPSTEWLRTGWARVTVLRDGPDPLFQGTFRIEDDNHHVATSSRYRQTRHADDPMIGDDESDDVLVAWRDSDVLPLPHGDELKKRSGLSASSGGHNCMSDELNFNADLEHPVYAGIKQGPRLGVMMTEEAGPGMSPWWVMSAANIFRRQDDGLGGNGNVDSLVSTIGRTEGCPSTRKVALIGVATDCTYFRDFRSREAVTSHVIDVVNSASAIFEETFNISIGLQNLTIIEDACPANPSSSVPWNVDCAAADISGRLNLFSKWRGESNDTNAYWTLLTKCNTASAVGLAWLGQLCSVGASSNGNETVAGANVVVRTSGSGSEWQVFAHESGHTFGAVHDCNTDACSQNWSTLQKCCPLSSSSCDAAGKFIMNPATSSGITAFSRCSVGNICTALLRQSVKSTCLSTNKNIAVITGQKCGNGIVEPGEDCDCGGPSGCAGNPCCDASTCKFTQGSVCDPSNEDCCTKQCQLASSSTVCRASTGACDPPETCDGRSPVCPADQLSKDGTDCGNGLKCASGQCTSRDLQCRSVVGVAPDAKDTYACEGSCRLACHSTSKLPDQFDCFGFMQYFLDGTPCAGGGICSNGVCTGASVVREAQDWISKNRNVAIPVLSIIGALALICIASCIIRQLLRCRTPTRRPPRKELSRGFYHQGQQVQPHRYRNLSGSSIESSFSSQRSDPSSSLPPHLPPYQSYSDHYQQNTGWTPPRPSYR